MAHPERDARSPWLALHDLCSLGVLMLGLALAVGPGALLQLQGGDSTLAMELWCAGMPLLAGLGFNVLALRVGLARVR